MGDRSRLFGVEPIEQLSRVTGAEAVGACSTRLTCRFRRAGFTVGTRVVGRVGDVSEVSRRLGHGHLRQRSVRRRGIRGGVEELEE